MIISFQPQFVQHPMWKQASMQGTAEPLWVPDVDENGVQRVLRESLVTLHEIYWPFGDQSAITANVWASAAKGFSDTDNPVVGKVWFIGTKGDAPGGDPDYLAPPQDFALVQDKETQWTIPARTKKLSFRLEPLQHPLYLTLEVKAK